MTRGYAQLDQLDKLAEVCGFEIPLFQKFTKFNFS